MRFSYRFALTVWIAGALCSASICQAETVDLGQGQRFTFENSHWLQREGLELVLKEPDRRTILYLSGFLNVLTPGGKARHVLLATSDAKFILTQESEIFGLPSNLNLDSALDYEIEDIELPEAGAPESERYLGLFQRHPDRVDLVLIRKRDGRFAESQVSTTHDLASSKIYLQQFAGSKFQSPGETEEPVAIPAHLFAPGTEQGRVILQAPELLAPPPPRKSPLGKALGQLIKTRQEFTALADLLKQVVFEQDAVVDQLVEASRVLDDPHAERPNVVVITGPSGVGKTFVAQELAKLKLPTAKPLIINGTDYMAGDDHVASILAHKLLGAEKAWKGDQKGELTEYLKNVVASTDKQGIIIINEAEKMHPFIITKLMEYFDTGVLKAGNEEAPIEAKRVLVVLTCNRGARKLIPEESKNWTEEQMREHLARVTPEQIRAEFTTKQKRFDAATLPEEVVKRVKTWILQGPLSKRALSRIFRAEVTERSQDLDRRIPGLKFDFSPEVLQYLETIDTDWSTDGRTMKRRAVDTFEDLEKALANALATADPAVLERWSASESIRITLALDPHGTDALVINDELRVPTLQSPKNNPLSDPAVRERIRRLEERLGGRVKGQGPMLENIRQLLTTHLGQANRERPTVFMTIGPTGTGKTETGKAVAQAVFDSEERAEIFDMGEVKSSREFSILFEQGLDGEESAFERFLRNNPRGGVLILDEASNMGGPNLAIKADCFKNLYGIFDRKTWTSKVTHRTYDLSNIIVQLTGNDGENHFIGVSDDDMRETIWQELQEGDNLHQLLLESGVPEALIGRLNALILTKPLSRAVAKEVSQKFLDQQVAAFRKQMPGIEVTYDPRLPEVLAESFYTPNTGMRSVRAVIDKRFNYAVISALLANQIDYSDPRQLRLRLVLEDNRTGLPYRQKGDPKRQINLFVEVTQKSALAPFQLDLTPWVQDEVLMSKEDAWITSIHEASHAVSNDPEITGEEVAFITIRGGQFRDGVRKIKYLGYARSRPVEGHANLTRQMVVGKLANIAAGSVGEILAGFPQSAGWSNDLRKMRAIGEHALIHAGFEPKFWGAALDPNGVPILSDELRQKLEREKSALIREAIALAKQRLVENWDYVNATAQKLFTEGSINGAKFKEVGTAVLSARKGARSAVLPQGLEAEFFRKLEKSRRAKPAPASLGDCESSFLD